MATHKVLRSIAHNTAHSLLSDMWWVADGFFYEHLYDAARAANTPHVEIDMQTGGVVPSAVATTPVRDALQHLPQAFARWVETGGAKTEMVQSARVVIDYDFVKSPPDPMTVPGRRRLYYQCVAEIVNDRGHRYSAPVVQHWEY